MAYYDKNETIAQAALDYIVAEYVAQGFPLPTLQRLGYAGMPLDCEQLIVYLARMYPVNQETGPESEGQNVQRCTFWAGSEIDVILMRCAPMPQPRGTTLQPVPPSVLAAFSTVMLRDPHVLQRGLLNAHRAGVFGEGASLTFLDTAPLTDQQGTLIGIRLRARVGNAF